MLQEAPSNQHPRRKHSESVLPVCLPCGVFFPDPNSCPALPARFNISEQSCVKMVPGRVWVEAGRSSIVYCFPATFTGDCCFEEESVRNKVTSANLVQLDSLTGWQSGLTVRNFLVMKRNINKCLFFRQETLTSTSESRTWSMVTNKCSHH